MANIAVVHHSGYGHTARQAQAVEAGVAGVAGAALHAVTINAEGDLPEGAWEALAAADAIVFGCPTYMGGPSWQFKKFADTSSKVWFTLGWRDKLAAGFTNSSTMNGDKFNTVTYLITLAMQHAMWWIGTGLMPANLKASTRDDVNYVGGFGGALSVSPADSSPDEFPNAADRETARLLGQRVAEHAVRMRG